MPVKPGGRRGFQIAVGVVEQQLLQTVVILAAGKARRDLYLQGILQLPNSIMPVEIETQLQQSDAGYPALSGPNRAPAVSVSAGNASRDTTGRSAVAEIVML